MVLARAHSLLTQSWHGVALGDIVAETVLPFEGNTEINRIYVEGPEVVVRANAAVSLSMIQHELLTNAVKYGALSRAGGKVAISWSLVEAASSGNSAKVEFTWTESGGPRVEKPKGRGFGTRLFEASADQLDAELSLDFAPQGFRCRMVLPITPVETAH
jgi:two-component sensor histidine kinase